MLGYRSATLHLDQLPLPPLAAKYGTPLYLYSAADIRARYRAFDRAFRAVPHTICYSVKANSNLAILKLLAREGAGFDVVSGGELHRVAAAARARLRHTVFSGVGKTAAELDAALRARILLFNVESEQELDLLAARAAALRRIAPIALRVNPDVAADTHPYISTGLREHKFGVAIAHARRLYRRAAHHRSLDVAGVSLHIGSQITGLAPFSEAVARAATLVRQLRHDGHNIRFLDAGGGLGINYHHPELLARVGTGDSPAHASARNSVIPSKRARARSASERASRDHALKERGFSRAAIGSTDLSARERARSANERASRDHALKGGGFSRADIGSTDSNEREPNDFSAYAESILSPLSGLDLHLLLEPGRGLLGPAGLLLTRVLYLKANGEKQFVITDAAMNDLLRPALYHAHHDIVPVSIASDRVIQSAGGAPAPSPAGGDPREGSWFPSADTFDIVGPVCETGDFFARDRALPAVAPGDLLAILDTGAYGMSLASNYNSRPRPAEVLVDGRRSRLIRRRESLPDLLTHER